MIDYSYRYSKRAKYLQLRISHAGLEVIIPHSARISTQIIEQFITQKEDWIEKNLGKLKQIQPKPSTDLFLPDSIHLLALNEVWKVNYLHSNKKLKLYVNGDRELALIGDNNNKTLCIKLLQKWLKEKACDYLSKELQVLSCETKLTYRKLTIRNNSTRWGSCSTKGSINLCCKLLFIPNHLVRHVILHELCHTRVMSHSNKFWKLFISLDPHARYHAKQLKLASQHVPSWIHSLT